MLLKLMKHDFRYSAKTFFALGAITIILSGIFIFAEYMFRRQSVIYAHMPERYSLSDIAANFSALLLTAIAIAIIIHIAYFYRKSMFGRTGHLTLTLPVNRGTLLASKLAVSFVWMSALAALATLAMTAVSFILWPRLSLGSIFAEILIEWTYITVVAFAAIALLFFCITLSHSVLAGVRLRGIITGTIGLLFTGLYTIGAYALATRFFVEFQRVFAEPVNLPLVGLQYGRIVVYSHLVVDRGMWYRHVYIDIFLLAFTLAVAAIAIAATHYLLKRRISMQ